MGIVAGIVVFSCTWWLVFFMLVSKGLEVDVNPMIGTPKGASKTFSFKQRFWGVTLRTGKAMTRAVCSFCVAVFMPAKRTG
jgi:predicted secreted protein